LYPAARAVSDSFSNRVGIIPIDEQHRIPEPVIGRHGILSARSSRHRHLGGTAMGREGESGTA
jgi:hypothetical protein